MTKTTKSAEAMEFPTFDPSKTTEQFREFAEKGVAQSKEAYAKFREATEDMQKTFESTYEQARTASDTLVLKSIAAMRANSDASFSHLEALVSVKSLSEAIELQTAFLRSRYEVAVEQAKEFQSISSKAVDDVSKPVKGMVEKSMKELKVA